MVDECTRVKVCVDGTIISSMNTTMSAEEETHRRGMILRAIDQLSSMAGKFDKDPKKFVDQMELAASCVADLCQQYRELMP
jgi:hypothetical protein